MEKKKVLFVGETWFSSNIEIKGVDPCTVGGYFQQISWVRDGMNSFAEITHMPCHEVPENFPATIEEMNRYDLIVLSDIGANSIVLHPSVTAQCQRYPNRLKVLAEWVRQGGAFGMIGGWVSFSGLNASAGYRRTPVEEILPVNLLPYDDREEYPEGLEVEVHAGSHPVLENLPPRLPYILGYNKLVAKPDAEVALSWQGDPILSLRQVEKGRTFAWASDCAPHWIPPEFCRSSVYTTLFGNIFNWVCPR